jgi:hypothetical protein
LSRAQARRVAAALGVGAATLAFFGLVAAPGAHAAGTVTVSPNANVTPSSKVMVSATGLGPGGTFSGLVALTQCGNASSTMVPLTSIGASDCDGQNQFPLGFILLQPVTSGSLASTSFTIRESGIGDNNDSCIPVTSPSQLPCSIVVADVATQGATVEVSGTYTLLAATTTTGGTTTTTTGGTTTTTTGSTTTTHSTTSTTGAQKTFTCDTIPLATSKLTVTPNRCLTNGQMVTVSAPAASFSASAVSTQATAFVLECNPDPSIPGLGGGCNIGGLQTPTINPDGSISLQMTVATGTVGSSVCPPTSAQVASFVSSNGAAGAVTCIIAAAPGPSQAGALAAPITFDGETATLPTSFVPTTPSPPGGSSGGSAGPPGGHAGAASATATTSPPAGTLAFTGARLWWLLLLGAALLDLGYLTWSAVRPSELHYPDP